MSDDPTSGRGLERPNVSADRAQRSPPGGLTRAIEAAAQPPLASSGSRSIRPVAVDGGRARRHGSQPAVVAIVAGGLTEPRPAPTIVRIAAPPLEPAQHAEQVDGGQRLGDRARPDRRHALGRLGGRQRQDGTREAEPGGFGETARRVGHLAQLAAQADLAARHDVGVEGPVGERRGDRQHHRQVGGRLDDADAADGERVDVVVGHRQGEALLQHGDQQRQAAPVEPLRRSTRRRQGRHGDQRLQLDEQRTAPLHGGHDHGPADPGPPIAEEQAARIGQAGEALLTHLEQAELLGRTEAVLHGPQQPEGVVTIALEGEHRVDHVLQLSRAGEATVLGDVAHEHDRAAPALRLPDEPVGRGADLRHRAGRRADVGVVHRLDRVDDHEVGSDVVQRRDDRRQRALGHEPDAVDHRVEPFGPEPHLAGRLLGADVEHPATVAGHRRRDLQQQGGLADARLARRASVTDPGTNPPPSTRSSSPTPVDRVGEASRSTSPIGSGAVPPSPTPSDRPPPERSSIRVFQPSHAAHRPTHAGAVAPQSEHRYTTRALAMWGLYEGAVTGSADPADGITGRRTPR